MLWLHPQVMTAQGFTVDEALHPLLKTLWRRDLKTSFSCQGGAVAEGDMLSYIWFDAGQEQKLLPLLERWHLPLVQPLMVPLDAYSIGYAEPLEKYTRETLILERVPRKEALILRFDPSLIGILTRKTRASLRKSFFMPLTGRKTYDSIIT